MIIRVFESPTNEGTKSWTVGEVNDRCAKEEHQWVVGHIEVCDPPVPERHERYNIYDTDHFLRAVIPARSCGYELDGELP